MRDYSYVFSVLSDNVNDGIIFDEERKRHLLTNCTKCSIYNLDKQYICDAQVSEIDDTQAALFLLDDYGDLLSTEVHVTFYDDLQGLVSYLCTLSSYKEVIIPQFRNYYSVICHLNSEEGVIQRRHDIKIKTDFEVELTTINSDDEELNIPVTVKDISAGGLFFLSTEYFYEGQEFFFVFDKGSIPLPLTAMVLRRQNTDDEEVYGYGCQFLRLSSAKESIIREFVFREQLRKKTL
ncbi:MAG: PilZ domain-containing protein [Lachnospiraceae bacterium]